MRSTVWEYAQTSTQEDLLTTGEAAVLLGVSRQHVVNLCDRGDLAYVTIGTHRRITRAEVEGFAAASARMSRDQRRSLWLAYATAAALVTDPEATLAVAHANLERLRARHTRGQAVRWLGEWQRLLDGPVDAVLRALTSPSLHGRELRQNNPFAGVLEEATRSRVLAAFSAQEAKPR